MKLKKLFLLILFLPALFSNVFSLEIKKNDLRVLGSTSNDKFSYGISQNKDDQLTASTEIHIFLPYLFFDLYINAITNRGFKSDITNPLTFTSSRYDELKFQTGTTINLLNISDFELEFTPQAGFCFLGNYGMAFQQNLNHNLCNVDEVHLDYETFDKSFIPVLNSNLTFSYYPLDFLKLQFDIFSGNSLFYSTKQNIELNAIFGDKTKLKVFTGYSWNQTHNDSPSLKVWNNTTQGFNYGFNLDTGLFVFDFITYARPRYGVGTISMDFMNLKKSSWQKTDLNFYWGLTRFINTEFMETQIQSPVFNNFSVYLNNKYVSGFRTNKTNPSAYRYERDYETITFGIKYEQPLSFINNWITPYIELGTGIASFGIQKLANHIPEESFDTFNLGTKTFWQLEANIGLDIIPQGLLNLGNAAYSLTIYAGTIFIPDSVVATKQIMLDTYRTADWQLHPFEFKWGFALHMGLDF